MREFRRFFFFFFCWGVGWLLLPWVSWWLLGCVLGDVAGDTKKLWMKG